MCGANNAMLACSRSIGDRNFKETDPPFVTAKPEVFTRQIDREKDEFLILASDGVWDDLSNNAACALVSKVLQAGQSCEEAAAALCEAALSAGSIDNVSAVVLLLR